MAGGSGNPETEGADLQVLFPRCTASWQGSPPWKGRRLEQSLLRIKLIPSSHASSKYCLATAVDVVQSPHWREGVRMSAHQPLPLEMEDLLGTTVGPTGLSLPDSASSRCSPNTQVFFPHLLQVFTERTSFTETLLDHSALKPACQSLNLSLPQSPPRLCKEQLPSSSCKNRICSPLLHPLSVHGKS